MTLSTVTLKWSIPDLIQSGLSGTLTILPTAQLSDTTDHELIPAAARRVVFSGGAGQLAGIVANDNANILPAGTGYLVSVVASNGQVIVPQFQTQILTANGATQWLDQLAVVPVVTTSYQYLPLPSGGPPAAGQVPSALGDGSQNSQWAAGGGSGSGTVTSVSVANANGFAGTVANATTTPAITIKTGVTGLLKGNGTAVSAATAGTDYDAAGAAATAQSDAESFATSAVATETSRAETAEALLAPLASPALTGTPAAPTATALTDSTQLATTAYADAAVAVETSRAETAEALKLAKASNLSDLASASTARTNLGLGSAATQASTAFDAAGAAATAQSNAEAASLPVAGGTMTGWLAPAVAALTFGSSVPLDAALGNAFAVTLTASTGTLATPSNPVDGQVIRVRVTQGSGGSFTLAYASAYDFGATGAPVLSTAAGKVDILGFEYVASISKWCYLGSGLGF